MKRLLLSAALSISLLIIVHAQEKNRNLISPFLKNHQQYNDRLLIKSGPGKEYREKYLLMKNNAKKQLNSIIYKPVKVTTDTMLYIYTYDGYGNCLTEVDKYRSKTDWVDLWKYTYTYDDSGKCLSCYWDKWQNGEWVHLSVRNYSYTFNDSGYTYSAYVKSWRDGEWSNSGNSILVYDKSGNCICDIFEEWIYTSDSPFLDSRRTRYTYDNYGNCLSKISESLENGTWVNTGYNYKYSYTYDNSGNILTLLMQSGSSDSWTSGIWEDKSKDTFKYDSLGNMIERLYQNWGAGKYWETDLKYLYTYDNAGNCLTDEIYILPTGGEWEKYWRYTYTYDIYGNYLSELEECGWIEGKQGEWVNNMKYIYTYDDAGNAVHEEIFRWLNDSWVYYYSGAQIWYNKHTERKGYGASIINVEYTAINITGVGSGKVKIDDFKLVQNYPNPFNPVTVISYQLPVICNVQLKVYDMLGREITTLVNKEQNAGNYKVEFNAGGLPSGIYLYRMQTGSFTDTKKFILMK